MRPGSAFLAQLRGELPIPCVALYSQIDNVVIPAVSGAWGNKIMKFANLGHVSFLYSADVFNILLSELVFPPRLDTIESTYLHSPGSLG
jgi:hypothetical protein